MKYALMICFILPFFHHQANNWFLFSEIETSRITYVEEESSFNQCFHHSNLQHHEIYSTKLLAADFSSDAVEICPKEHIQFIDASTGDIIAWEWYFEGGMPSSSTEQNPIVYYPEPGIFDVTLMVFDGINSDTLSIENYVYIIDFPEVTFSELPQFYIDDTVYHFVEGSPEGGVYEGPGVFFGNFVPLLAGIGEHTLFYYYVDENGCVDTAIQLANVSVSTNVIDNHRDICISVIPNPAKDYCWIEFQLSDVNNLYIEILDHTGRVVNTLPVYSLQSAGNKRKVNIHSLKAGLYFLRIVEQNRVLAIDKLIIY